MTKVYILFVLMISLLISCGNNESGEFEQKLEGGKIVIPEDAITTESGLKYKDVKTGDGAMPQKGQTVAFHYTGKLMDGKVFDSSLDRNQTLEVAAGMGQLIPGFDEGLMGMRVGGKRTLYIPSNLGYGSQGAPGVIPPNSDLVFEIELIEIK
jgi:peptidylprolyl isomerase